MHQRSEVIAGTQLLNLAEQYGRDIFATTYTTQPPAENNISGKPLSCLRLSMGRDLPASTLPPTPYINPVTAERLEIRIATKAEPEPENSGSGRTTQERKLRAENIGRVSRMIIGPEFNVNAIKAEAVVTCYGAQLQDGQSNIVDTLSREPSKAVVCGALGFMRDILSANIEPRKTWSIMLNPLLGVSGRESTIFLEKFYDYLSNQRDNLSQELQRITIEAVASPFETSDEVLAEYTSNLDNVKVNLERVGGILLDR